jgi:hypothetical protein
MADRTVPDLSHLRGAELEKVVRSLTAGTIETVIANREAIIALKTEDLKKLNDVLASIPVAHCGGLGCG